ncbi:MAG TPA: thiamine phosphate synthase [Longimicrobiales bacterium]|nr:thiamine phosphate synthase [Longimicrobiales bacterium]
MLPPRLHLITDDELLAQPGFPEMAHALLAACGPRVALHLRGHATPAALRHDLGADLAAAALRTGAWLLVNDRVDIAMAVRANGVQLGAASLPVPEARALLGAGARIGYSAHSVAETLQAEADGADFVLVGTIWASASHPGRDPAGADLLAGCAGRAGVPVFAIGGVTEDRVAAVADAGGYGVAVLGGVWHAGDPLAAVDGFIAAIRAAWPSAEEEA